MAVDQDERQQVLIVDDSEINRAILADMLHEEFEVLQAASGQESILMLTQCGASISLVLLDLAMPEMDGFEVLEKMAQLHLVRDIPVIMLSTENHPACIKHAYDLGVRDFITRPFDSSIVYRRVLNTIFMHTRQTRLLDLMTAEIAEHEASFKLIVDAFGKVFAFLCGEINARPNTTRVVTELLLNRLVRITDHYSLSRLDICQISAASLLHDFGKLSIDRALLHKTRPLTAREYDIVETHTNEGVNILNAVQFHGDETLIQKIIDICRWHHERYDGCGYPDGLAGDEIPIWSQVVGLADAYDALTSARTYRNAYSHQKAIQMIMNGECGVFNPLLLKSLLVIEKSIPTQLRAKPSALRRREEMRSVIDELVRGEDFTSSQRVLRLLEQECNKRRFFTDLSRDILFEYISSPPALFFTEWGANQLGVDKVVTMPHSDKRLTAFFSPTAMDEMAIALRGTTPDQPIIQRDFQITMHGTKRCCRLVCKANWNREDPPRYIGALGKATEICESQMELVSRPSKMIIDPVTGLPTHGSVRLPICQKLKRHKQDTFALLLLDLDGFREANSLYGHDFGNELLRFAAERLLGATVCAELCARVGGDEFLIFLKQTGKVSTTAERFLSAITTNFSNVMLNGRMGIALSENGLPEYDTLLTQASHALSAAKRSEDTRWLLYDNTTMKGISPVFSLIDSPA